MNSLYNHALKQTHALQRDLDKFESGEDASAGLQGQITAAFSTLQRSIDDYDNLAKREMVPAKKETAFTRVTKFRHDLQDMRSRFEMIKKQQESRRYDQNRENLLRRSGSSNLTTTANEYPYMSRPEFAMRESAFIDHTDSLLDSYITQAQHVLGDMVDQNSVLKKTQRKLLDAANSLGLSSNVIRYIERRTAQDKWIFIAGLVITIGLMWAIAHYLG
ncbi:hypothetical protein BX666DRAFT_1906280 [Dichotomocladium elegans]|nr:hypothetical protein BX666DRAFT_1906280 [Dichotomocladium elegans]